MVARIASFLPIPALLLLLGAAPAPAAAQEAVPGCGDLDLDGDVDSADARRAQRCAVGEIPCPPNCDVDLDGRCGSADARRIQRVAIGELDAADLACLGSPELATAAYHWFLLAGQSNMVGASSQSTPAAPGASYRPDGTWWPVVVDPEVHGVPGPDRGSPWPRFALEYAEEGLTPVFIATAHGGTCLLDWPDKPGPWEPRRGSLYQQALSRWREVGRPDLRAVLWLQGECDAQQAHNQDMPAATLQERYRSALMELGTAIQADFGAPLVAAPISLRWCAWENSGCAVERFRESDPKRLPVVLATIATAYEHPNVFLGPIHHDLRMMPDGAHTWDVDQLGLRWFETVRQVLPDPASPP